MESCRGPAVLRRGSGYVCACPTEAVQRVAAAMACARTHGPHAAAVHDPQHMYQHAAVAAHHADGAATRGSFPVQGHSRGQCVGDTPHDSVLHPCIWTSRRRGDQSAGAYR